MKSYGHKHNGEKTALEILRESVHHAILDDGTDINPHIGLAVGHQVRLSAVLTEVEALQRELQDLKNLHGTY